MEKAIYNQQSGYLHDETAEPIVVDIEYEPIILPVKQYEFFMANGARGIEAMTLLLHLLYTSKRQHTNQVWAANTYLRRGLDMGERTVIRAKKFLADHGFIQYIQSKSGETGRFDSKTYIKICYMRNPGPKPMVSTGVELAPSTAVTDIAVTAYKCLKKQDKCLKKKEEETPPTESQPAEPAAEKPSTFWNKIKSIGAEMGVYGFNESVPAKLCVAFMDLRDLGLTTNEQWIRRIIKEKKNPAFIVNAISNKEYAGEYKAKKIVQIEKNPCPVCGNNLRDNCCYNCVYDNESYTADQVHTAQQLFQTQGLDAAKGYLQKISADSMPSFDLEAIFGKVSA
jgi:hypothetical protein